MKLTQRQRRIWVFIAVVAAVSLVALLVRGRPSGPTYKGRTVAEWLDRLPRGSAISTNVEVSGMLMTLGSNAVPALVEILHEGSSWRRRLLSAVAENGWVPARFRAEALKNSAASAWQMRAAAMAFEFLGVKAKAAIPDLERIASEPYRNWGQASALHAFSAVAAGIDTFPAVIRIATNAPGMNRPNIDIWLRSLLHGSYTELGLQAALALCELGSPPPEVIPPLVQCIGSVRSPHRRYAMQTLAKLAPQYAAARDAIREVSEGDDPAIRELARAVLDQQMAAKPSKTN